VTETLGTHYAPPAVRFDAAHPVLRFLAKRVVAGVLTLFVVSILIFFGTEVLPGNVAQAILGQNATPGAMADLRRNLELDEPLHTRYFAWLTGFVRGDLGKSAARVGAGVQNAGVWQLISSRLENTLLLAGLTILFTALFGIGLGVVLAAKVRRKLDLAVSVILLALISLPEFVVATILILVFSTSLHVLPPVSLVFTGASPLSNPKILVLPVMTLLAVTLAYTVRMVRASMFDALQSDYIELARLSGYSERRIVFRYALRNAAAPILQVMALNVLWLIGGVVVVEFVFGYPGLGEALVEAVAIRDVTFVQSVAMLIATAYVVINILSDLAITLLVPKLRTSL